MRPNHSWKDYFVFTKRERKVVILLLFVILFVSVFNNWYHPVQQPLIVSNLDEVVAKLASQETIIQSAKTDDFGMNTSTAQNHVSPDNELFFFDPNTLDEAGFLRLGLKAKLIQTIIHYRNKGGRFYKAVDLQKIYGLNIQEANRLLPFVRISTLQKQTDDVNTKFEFIKSDKFKPRTIDINSATAEQWKSLPAIGDVLSNRIVKYREKLGGFSSIDQIKKTYGLSDSAYAAILPYLSFSSSKSTNATREAGNKRLNINSASADELKANAAIPPEVADAIVIYRKQHGSYSSVEDIRKIVFITESVYLQVAPFLSVE